MLLDMQITMPSQDPLAEQEFSLAQRDIRKWLKALPYIDLNVAAQQFYDGLRRSNRQSHATKQRLSAIEQMLPSAYEFLANQRKYLAAQPFPLSKKASEILKLQQNILSELAVAYKIIVQETINREIQLNPKKLALCVHRAMHYMLEQYITLAHVYSEPPKGYWQDYCQLYKMAEQLELTEIIIKNNIDAKDNKTTVKCLFNKACLLSLSNLHTLGHGESSKVANYLETISHLSSLSIEPSSNETENTYLINLAVNKPPRLIRTKEIPMSSENRYLDLNNVIEEIKKLTDSENNKKSILSTNSLNNSLANRILSTLVTKQKRASKRVVNSSRKLSIALGLRDSIHTLLNIKTNIDEKAQQTNESKFDLLAIEDNPSYPSNSAYSLFDQVPDIKDSENAWDNVEHRAMSVDSISAPTTKPDKTKDKVSMNPVIQSWEISNASNGGYCLLSENNSDYQSQVGDLVLLQLEDSADDNWRIGVIRWMQALSNNGVKIGIETLNGSVEPVEVCNSHYVNNKFKGLEHILLLREETKYGTTSSILAPPNSIEAGTKLELMLAGEEKTITFENAIERTISFVRFSYNL